MQQELVERARRGDAEAFTELARATVARLDAAARLILRDPDLAQDAVQDAYARAWRDIPRLREVDRFDAWLHRLLANACRDQLRHRRRRPIEVALVDSVNPSAPDAFGARLDRDELDRVLQRLAPEQRAVLVLRFYLELSVGEVASVLGIPEGTVKSRLHRSLAEMRAELEADARVPTAHEGGPA